MMFIPHRNYIYGCPWPVAVISLSPPLIIWLHVLEYRFAFDQATASSTYITIALAAQLHSCKDMRVAFPVGHISMVMEI
jgi:hypothetical protein